MNRRHAVWFGAVTIAAAVIMATWLNQRTGKLPPDIYEKMDFPAGLEQVTGDKNGVVCHEVRLLSKSGEQTIVWHKLWEHDFRKLSPAEKEAVIRKDVRKDMEDVGLACTSPDGKVWLHQAYAQPHCEDCGGGCGTRSCPGTLAIGGGCLLGGTTCVITFICCSGPCPPCG